MKDYQNYRILVTGATGFIGRHLYRHLTEDLKCRYVYRLIRNKNKVLREENNDIYADIANQGNLKTVIEETNPQIIFHLAADISPSRSVSDVDKMTYANLLGTLNLLTAVQTSNIRLCSFINLGSCEEYGLNEQPFTENLIPSPISIYSGTKAAAFMLCKMFYNLFNMPVIHVRPSLVYGPGQSERFFIDQAIRSLISNSDFHMTHGEQTRDFIFVDDVVKGLVELSWRNELAGEVFNISSGKEYFLRDIVTKILHLTSSKSKIHFGSIPYRDGEIMRFACSNEKILTLTEWKPKVKIEEGLVKTIKSYGSVECE